MLSKERDITVLEGFGGATTHSPQRTREPVLVLRQVLVSGPITALAAASPRQKVTFLGGAHKAIAVDVRRVHKDVTGP